MTTPAWTLDQSVKLSSALIKATQVEPYLAQALRAMSLIPAPGTGTFAIDKWWRCYLDPQCVETWPVETIGTALRHEVRHVMYRHAGRADALGIARTDEREDWNKAADAPINSSVEAAGQAWWPFPVVHAHSIRGAHAGMISEELYALLRAERVGVSDNPQPGPVDSQDSPGGGGDIAGDTDPGAAGGPPGAHGEDDSDDDDESSPCCGGGSGAGDPRPDEQPAPADGGDPGIDDTIADVVLRRTATAIADHQAKRPGTLPGDLEIWAQNILSPVHDWRRELAAAVRSAVGRAAGARDYSYRRRSTRTPPGSGLILPGMVKADPPPVDVLVDTSGSMSSLIADALGEVEGVIANRGRTRIIACDTHAGDPQIVRHAADLELSGGGGTDLRVGLELLDTLRPRARVRVVVTDTHTPWPEAGPRGVKTIVAAVGGGRHVPAWAKLVEIPKS